MQKKKKTKTNPKLKKKKETKTNKKKQKKQKKKKKKQNPIQAFKIEKTTKKSTSLVASTVAVLISGVRTESQDLVRSVSANARARRQELLASRGRHNGETQRENDAK